MGDLHRLHQALMNLLRNAQRHTPSGTTITVGVEVPDKEHVAVLITDNGPGIPTAIQDRIFDRFVRADSSRSRDTGSTGLGMSIVQAIITAHGGTISVTSDPGNTVVTVVLPTAAYQSHESSEHSGEVVTLEVGTSMLKDLI